MNVARITRRPSSTDTNLIVGMDFGNVLKDGIVYELYQFDGEIIIREIGQNLDTIDNPVVVDNIRYRSVWNHDVSYMLESGGLRQLLSTEDK